MLVSIVLTLSSAVDQSLPQHLGRANYAALLLRMAEYDTVLAGEIHDNDGPKPVTCSSLMDAEMGRSGTVVKAGRAYRIRMTGLTGKVSETLLRCLVENPPATWLLDACRFDVMGAVCDIDADVWSGHADYQSLVAQNTFDKRYPEKRVTLQFYSPTAFKSKGFTVPVPLPGLVFGSLVERWNSFSPVVLSPEMRRYGEEAMVISRYKLESRAVTQKDAGLRIGGVGTATYRALTGDRYWLSVMHMLADFAFYSGVGVQTATGMGQVRRAGG